MMMILQMTFVVAHVETLNSRCIYKMVKILKTILHHPHIEVFHFDTIDEADEFRMRAHELMQRKRKRIANRVMQRKQMHVTRDDLKLPINSCK